MHIQIQSVNPIFDSRVGCAARKPLPVYPRCGRRGRMKICRTCTYAAAAGRAERYDRLSRKIITFKEGVNDFRRLSPPNRIADKYDVAICCIYCVSRNFRTASRIVLFSVRAAVAVAVIQICGGVGDRGRNPIERTVRNRRNLFGNAFCGIRTREVGNQDITAYAFGGVVCCVAAFVRATDESKA